VSLKSLVAEGRLRAHRTSAKEVADLLRVVERDLRDACIPQLSADRRFATAYNAALQLATVALAAAGYRTSGTGHHWATWQALPEFLGSPARPRADYLDRCRSKRNVTDYDRAGEVSDREAQEIIAQARAFRVEVLAWLQRKHPVLLPKRRT